MDYKVVNADTVSKLEERVNALIQRGYRPIGGVTYEKGREYKTIPNGDDTYWQAMFKQKES